MTLPVSAQDWHNDSYFKGTSELGVRVGRDSWTWTPDRMAFVISCVINRKSDTRTINIFVRLTGIGLHRSEELLKAKMKIGKTVYPLDVLITTASVDTFSVPLSAAGDIIKHMKRARSLKMIVPCAACGVTPFVKEFSLTGFTKASINTLTSCGY